MKKKRDPQEEAHTHTPKFCAAGTDFWKPGKILEVDPLATVHRTGKVARTLLCIQAAANAASPSPPPPESVQLRKQVLPATGAGGPIPPRPSRAGGRILRVGPGPQPPVRPGAAPRTLTVRAPPGDRGPLERYGLLRSGIMRKGYPGYGGPLKNVPSWGLLTANETKTG